MIKRVEITRVETYSEVWYVETDLDDNEVRELMTEALDNGEIELSYADDDERTCEVEDYEGKGVQPDFGLDASGIVDLEERKQQVLDNASVEELQAAIDKKRRQVA